jgi:hypothetical protein
MPTTEIQAECLLAERINPFVANRLDAAARKALVAHLAVCEPCAALLRDLREDARLSRIPLTLEERSRIRALVSEVRDEVAARLEDDRRERERPARAAQAPQFEPPGMALLPSNPGRALWLSAGAAALFAAALCLVWWLV